MQQELEYKYLVKDYSFLQLATDSHEIRQGYLSRSTGRSVRVRICDEKGYFTIKGPFIESEGRDEFEFEISLSDAEAMLALCPMPVISKTRYVVTIEDDVWEVDVFHGELTGLVTAEIEVRSNEHPYSLPSFVGRSVTNDSRFKNTNLTTYEALKSAL